MQYLPDQQSLMEPGRQFQKLANPGRFLRGRRPAQNVLTLQALLWAVPMIVFWHGLWQVLDALAAYGNRAVSGGSAMVAVLVAVWVMRRWRGWRS